MSDRKKVSLFEALSVIVKWLVFIIIVFAVICIVGIIPDQDLVELPVVAQKIFSLIKDLAFKIWEILE